ncbi:MAG TPA: hypothetical protein VNU44_07270 [Bryobacteraceae bacterium]|jgi:hypothetical protein|nr:hypothetical protein [Bryobacteraceae bacterium]
MKIFLAFFGSLILCGAFAAGQQVGCLATTNSVVGSYTYTAVEVPLSGVAITPPGTTTNTQVYSNTSIGKLVGSINGGGVFSLAGVLYFDGAGNVSVAATSSPLGASANVGTYTVNTDCTINVTLSDVFNTTTSGPGVTTPTLGKASLIGMVLGGGSEIDLTAAQSTPLVAGEFASRLDVQLIRTFTYGCGVSNLTGAYGFVGTGYVMTSASVQQPATLFARLRFDGNGNVILDTVASGSPLGSFQYAGTYTVNLDCSGSITLTPAASPTGTSTGSAITASMVLTPPVAYVTNGTASLTGSADRPSIQFTLTNAGETFTGYGRAQ